MKLKSLVITAVLATAILCSGGYVGAIAQPTATDNSALIAQLQAQIQSLMQQIAALQAQQGPGQSWCHTFNANMGVGSNGDEVTNLITALQQSGIPTMHAGTGLADNYSEDTASSVVKFQTKYGITPQSGYVGIKTRAKLNALYGCKEQNQNQCNIDSDCASTTMVCAPGMTKFGAKCVDNKCMAEKCVPSTQPSITVTSPNGGETWKVGDIIPIRFNTNIPENQTPNGITLQLYKNQSGVKTYISNIVINYIGGSPYNWTVPTTITPGQYYIYASAQVTGVVLPEGGVSDFSDNYFTIIAPTQLSVSCEGNPSYASIGQTVNWYAHPSGSSSGTYQWSGDVSGTAPQISTSYTTSGTKTANIVYTSNGVSVSGSCAMTVNAQPSITVTSPIAGSNLQIGTKWAITWDSTGLPSNALLSIGINGDGQTSTIAGGQIATNIPASEGLYYWTVPSQLGESLSGKKYQVYATCINCSPIVGGLSDYFNVVYPCLNGAGPLLPGQSYCPTTSINSSNNNLASISNALAEIMRKLSLLK